MIFDLRDFQLSKGGYSIVLVDKENKKAYKIFKSYDHPDLQGTGEEERGREKSNLYRRTVFETERNAYELIQSSELLKTYTPQYYGTLELEQITQDGEDKSIHYLLDCCLVLEYIEGEFIDIQTSLHTGIIKNLEIDLKFSYEEILNEFKKLGIKYTIDSAAIHNKKEFKVIDFGTQDPFEFEPILE
jgi:hypothetical protein